MPDFNKDNDEEDEYVDPQPRPSTVIGIDQEITMDLNDNTLRAITIDQVDANAQKTHQIPKLKWKAGDKYEVYCATRFRNNSKQNDWRVNFGTMTLTVLEVSSDGKTGKFRLQGSMPIDNTAINNTDPNNPKISDPDNWFFGGYLGKKIDASGAKTTLVNPIQDETSKPGQNNAIKFSSPDKFLAVSPKATSFEMDIPFGIPLQKIELYKAGNKIEFRQKQGLKFQVRPIGNILCFKLKNELATSIALPTDQTQSKIKVTSKFMLNTDIKFTFWNYQYRLPDMGTDKWVTHFAVIKRPTDNSIHEYYDKDGVRKTQEMAIDWSQYKKTNGGQFIDNGGKVVIDSGEEVNLYVWSVYNVYHTNDSGGAYVNSSETAGDLTKEHPITIDYSSLGLMTPVYTPGDSEPKVTFRKILTDNIKNNRINYYGGVSHIDHYENTADETYLYKKTRNISLSTFKLGASYTIVLPIKSQPYISEVFYYWNENTSNKLAQNFGIVEIYNPNKDDADLKDYYLARLIYGNNNSLKFRSTWSNDWENLRYALLMPLNVEQSGNNKYRTLANGTKAQNTQIVEVTPVGDIGRLTAFADVYNGNKESTDPNNNYMAEPVIYAPNLDEAVTNFDTKLKGGHTICYGGAGIFATAHQNPDLLYQSEYLATPALKNNKYSRLVGVADGMIGKDDFYDRNNYRNISNSSAREYFGVMARNYDEGWALVKKLPDGKFYIIDSFGPATRTYTDGQWTSDEFRGFMQAIKTTSSYFGGKMRYWMPRAQESIFPNGGKPYSNAWRNQHRMADDVELSEDRISAPSIGNRAKYLNSGERPQKIKYTGNYK